MARAAAGRPEARRGNGRSTLGPRVDCNLLGTTVCRPRRPLQVLCIPPRQVLCRPSTASLVQPNIVYLCRLLTRARWARALTADRVPDGGQGSLALPGVLLRSDLAPQPCFFFILVSISARRLVGAGAGLKLPDGTPLFWYGFVLVVRLCCCLLESRART